MIKFWQKLSPLEKERIEVALVVIPTFLASFYFFQSKYSYYHHSSDNPDAAAHPAAQLIIWFLNCAMAVGCCIAMVLLVAALETWVQWIGTVHRRELPNRTEQIIKNMAELDREMKQLEEGK